MSVINLVEYQGEVQRSPKELLDFLNTEIEKGELTTALVIYNNGKTFSYALGATDRDYAKCEALWDAEQWKKEFIK